MMTIKLHYTSLFASLLLCPLVLTGCSNMVTTAATSTPAVTGSITGLLHGGQQPVANATVTLWAAGNAGYGSASSSLAVTTTDSGGNFSFGPGSGHTYSCPSSTSTTTSQQLYIIINGGQPSPGVTNSAAAFLAGVGDCATAQTTNPNLLINEVTTAASIYALQQFFTPGTNGLGSIGTSATNITGLRNAFYTINNLVTLSTGTSSVRNISAAVNGYTTNPVVTVTPDIAKINTIGNVLAACINSTGSASAACTTLLNDVAATPAQDTLQAAYDLAVNPTSTVNGTSNIAAIYNTSSPQPPFSPSLPAAPADWTLGITYGSSASQTVTATPVYLLTQPAFIAIDSQGNIWLANNGNATAATPGNSITELSVVGLPQAQALTAAGNITAPSALVVDPSNNVYVSSYGTSGAGNQLAEYTNLNATQSYTVASTGPAAMASDGAGNIYIANYGGASGSGDIEVIPASSATGTIASSQATAVSVGLNSSLAIDANNTLWLSNNPATATVQYICSANPCTATATTVARAPQSIAIDHSGNIWIGNTSSTGAGSFAVIAETSTTTMSAVTSSPFTGGGLANPLRGIIDGDGNSWATNFSANAGSVSELTNAGSPVSPSTGFAHTYDGASGIAIDPSGNVWIGNSAAAASATVQGYITEIVGQAAPVATPLSAGLPTRSGGANRLGTRP